MKKLTALVLSLMMVLTCSGNITACAEAVPEDDTTVDNEAVITPSEDGSASEQPSESETLSDLPTADDLGGYENICLSYNFRSWNLSSGRYDADDFAPYVAYLDEQGNAQDYFFDSYLFLPYLDYGPSGARMHVDVSNPTKAIDWTSYVNDTFTEGKNAEALNTAFGDVKNALGDGETDKKAGVFFTILYPCATATNFGSLGGRQLDFSKTEDRKYAIKWIIDEQVRLFNESGCDDLELVGFYWLEEFILEDGDVELLQYTSEYLHSLGLKFIWIPWYLATGYDRVDEFGFDAVCMQPNLFWLGYTDPNRVNDSIEYSEQYGMGMEIELDYRVSSDYYFNRYLYYLEGGMNSKMMDSVKMYYQDASPGVFYHACYESYGRYRDVYDLTYKYAKGTLTQEDIDAARPQGCDDNYVDDVDLQGLIDSADWISVGKSYSGCPSYVDGNGAPYQNVSGNELTDGIIATEDLGTDWFAFHQNILDDEGRMSITLDLGEVRSDLTHFAAHFDNKQQYAIGSPMDIKLYVSDDGVNFRHLVTPKLKLDPVNSVIYYECKPVTARYVKLSIGRSDKIYVFCSEFLVGVDKSEPDYILGDVNNNGEIDSRDYVYLKRAYFNTYKLDELGKLAGDITQNGEIDSRDYVFLKRAYFNTYKIQQPEGNVIIR